MQLLKQVTQFLIVSLSAFEKPCNLNPCDFFLIKELKPHSTTALFKITQMSGVTFGKNVSSAAAGVSEGDR